MEVEHTETITRVRRLIDQLGIDFFDEVVSVNLTNREVARDSARGPEITPAAGSDTTDTQTA